MIPFHDAREGAVSTEAGEPQPAAVSVVIVNYNAGEVLADCLRSVLPQVREVVVVDNASRPDAFEAVVARFEDNPRLRVIRSQFNGGFAYGCNLGIAACSEPSILLLNPDCMAAAGAIETLCAALHADPRVGMVGGFITCPDGTEQSGGRRAVPTPWRSFVRAFRLSGLSKRWPKLFDDFCLHLRPRPTETVSVEAISGACTLLKREALDAVGRLDDGYFLHCEDLDLCMRFRQGGWDIRFVPDSLFMHYKGVCSRNRVLFVEWHKHKGMMRFYRKHFRHQYPAGLMGLVAVGVWGRFGAIAGRHLVLRLLAGAARLPSAAAGLSSDAVRRRAAARPAVRRATVSTRPMPS